MNFSSSQEGRIGGDVKEYAEGARTEVSRKDLNGWGWEHPERGSYLDG